MFFNLLNNKKAVVYFLLAAAASYGGYLTYQKLTALPQYNKLEPVPAGYITIGSRFLLRRETLPGKLEAADSVVIISEVPGRIKTLNINEGQFVKEGTVLVQLDDSQERANLAGYDAEVEKHKTYISKATLLSEQGDIPTHTLKDKEADLAVVISKKEQSQAALEKMRIVAPFDGVIGIRKVSVGAHVNQNTEIGRLSKLNPLRVRFSVPADRIPYVTEGNKLQVFVGDDALPVEGTIIAKEPSVHDTTHLIDVVASIDNSAMLFLPGQYVRVNLVTSKEEEVLAVPEQALIYGENDKSYVFIIRHGIAIKTEVELGPRRGEGFIEALGGLSSGDEVINNIGETRNLRISDGMPIKKIQEGEEVEE